MTIQAFLGVSGALHRIEHDGRVYVFGRLDQRAMGGFSSWLIERARRTTVALYGHDPALLDEKLRQLEKDAFDGAYEFFEEIATGVEVEVEDPETGEVRKESKGGILHTKAGMLALISILMGCGETEAIAVMAARRAEVTHLLRMVLAESLPGYGKQAAAAAAKEQAAAAAAAKEQADPNARAPLSSRS